MPKKKNTKKKVTEEKSDDIVIGIRTTYPDGSTSIITVAAADKRGAAQDPRQQMYWKNMKGPDLNLIKVQEIRMKMNAAGSYEEVD